MIREDTGTYIIEEWPMAKFGECRFALDRRDDGRLINIGWYKTYRGALNALSMERPMRIYQEAATLADEAKRKISLLKRALAEADTADGSTVPIEAKLREWSEVERAARFLSGSRSTVSLTLSIDGNLHRF